MSAKKWQKLVGEKAEVEQQNANILAAIKNNKISKEFGQLSGEELFKPITSRLEKLQVGDSNSVAGPKEEVPDYGMEDFDLINPFNGDFNPDAETPPPSPSPPPPPPPSPPPPSPPLPPSPPPSYYTSSPPPSPLPPLAEEEEMEEEQPGKSGKWGAPKEPGIKGSESVDLQTLSSMLTKNKDNPNYVVKSKKSKFHGYTLADIKKAREEILERRKGNKQPSGVPRTPRVQPQEEPDSGVNPQDESNWEMEGSGSVDPNALVEQLHLSLASIRAGNTSLKLKKRVEYMLGFLEAAGEITQKEVHNILSNII